MTAETRITFSMAYRAHECGVCAEEIMRGEDYGRVVRSTDDMVVDYAICMVCDVIAAILPELSPESDKTFAIDWLRARLDPRRNVRDGLYLKAQDLVPELRKALFDREIRLARADRIARRCIVLMRSMIGVYRTYQRLERLK